MKLHCEVSGRGPALLLLHGWGLNRHVWRSIERLEQRFTLMRVDLPGYGKSPLDPTRDYDLASLSRKVAELIESSSIVMGWSLGGLVAMQLAISYPHKVNKLVSLAAAAQFVAGEDWPSGVEASIFSDFGEALINDYRATIQRFLAIQSIGSDKAREEIRALKEVLFIDGEPEVRALVGGLDILRNSRLQAQLAKIHCPSLFMGGEKDTLLKPASVLATAERVPGSRVVLIDGAGHAPFISHPQEFMAQLEFFLDA